MKKMKTLRACVLGLIAILFVQCGGEKPAAKGPVEDLAKTEKDFFSTEQDVSGLYGSLQDDAGTQSIAVARFKAEPHRKSKYCDECPVSMDLDGDFAGLSNVILWMSKRTPVLIIEEATLKGNTNPIPGHSVKAALQFSVFLAVKPSPSEEGKPHAGHDVIEALHQDRYNVARALNEMQSALTPELWLTESHITEDRVQIKGATRDETSISGYIKNLKASKELASVEVVEIKMAPAKSKKTTTFTLDCRLKASEGDYTPQGEHARDPFVPRTYR